VAIDKAPEGTTVDSDLLYFPDGTQEIISNFAQDQLGLTHDQAMSIFYADSPQAANRLRYVADHPNADWNEIDKAHP
jgi:hypothetical protein